MSEQNQEETIQKEKEQNSPIWRRLTKADGKAIFAQALMMGMPIIIVFMTFNNLITGVAAGIIAVWAIIGLAVYLMAPQSQNP